MSEIKEKIKIKLIDIPNNKHTSSVAISLTKYWTGVSQHLAYFYLPNKKLFQKSHKSTWFCKRWEFAQKAIYYWLESMNFQMLPCECLIKRWFIQLGSILTDAPLNQQTWNYFVKDLIQVESFKCKNQNTEHTISVHLLDIKCRPYFYQLQAWSMKQSCMDQSWSQSYMDQSWSQSYMDQHDMPFYTILVICNTILYSLKQQIMMSNECTQMWWRLFLTSSSSPILSLYLAEIGAYALKYNLLGYPIDIHHVYYFHIFTRHIPHDDFIIQVWLDILKSWNICIRPFSSDIQLWTEVCQSLCECGDWSPALVSLGLDWLRQKK